MLLVLRNPVDTECKTGTVERSALLAVADMSIGEDSSVHVLTLPAREEAPSLNRGEGAFDEFAFPAGFALSPT
jgi:hypothetical protein